VTLFKRKKKRNAKKKRKEKKTGGPMQFIRINTFLERGVVGKREGKKMLSA